MTIKKWLLKLKDDVTKVDLDTSGPLRLPYHITPSPSQSIYLHCVSYSRLKVTLFCVPVPQVWSWRQHGGSHRAFPASRCAWQPCVDVPAGGSASVVLYWPPASAAWRNSRRALPPSKPATGTWGRQCISRLVAYFQQFFFRVH